MSDAAPTIECASTPGDTGAGRRRAPARAA
jgi:hypothetical protein